MTIPSAAGTAPTISASSEGGFDVETPYAQ
jgi:hypothetical protein